MANKWEIVDFDALIPPSKRGRAGQFTLKKVMGMTIVLAHFTRENGTNGAVHYSADVYANPEDDTALGTARLPQAFGKKAWDSLAPLPAARRSQVAIFAHVGQTDKGGLKLTKD